MSTSNSKGRLTHLLNAMSARRLLLAGLIFGSLSLASCGWVDSTGTSNAKSSFSADFGAAPASDGLNAPTVLEIETVRIVQIVEENTVRVTPNTSLGNIVGWNWTPAVQNAAATECSSLLDYNPSIARQTLNSACTSSDQCEMLFAQRNNDQGSVTFDISLPKIIAPVGLSYRLTATDSLGKISNEYFSICAISVNEAPEARDDVFTIILGETRVVRSNDIINLLSNDVDDIDANNSPLSVNINPVRAPTLAQSFQLQSNGGFIYTAPAQLSNQSGSSGTDSFVYQISDGQHTATATATLRLVESNSAPVLLSRIPNTTATVGTTIVEGNSAFNMSRFFSDPDGGQLQFSTLSGSLPPSGNLQLSPAGYLFGEVTSEDSGDYSVTVIASDGELTMSDTFTLSVAGSQSSSSNSEPIMAPIDDLVVEEGQRINKTIIASDPDNDRIEFSLSVDSPDFITINRNTGRIGGSAEVPGQHAVTVIVSDSNSSIQRTFLIIVIREANAAPSVDDIANLTTNQPFSHDVGQFFSDADGDIMTFTANRLPPDTDLSADGVLTGIPTTANRGRHFITITADDGHDATASDGFLLIIR